jgi:hypothetical protein
MIELSGLTPDDDIRIEFTVFGLARNFTKRSRTKAKPHQLTSENFRSSHTQRPGHVRETLWALRSVNDIALPGAKSHTARSLPNTRPTASTT